MNKFMSFWAAPIPMYAWSQQLSMSLTFSLPVLPLFFCLGSASLSFPLPGSCIISDILNYLFHSCPSVSIALSLFPPFTSHRRGENSIGKGYSCVFENFPS